MAKMLSGQLAVWKDKKGFGFIKPDHGSDDVFIHITAMQFASRRPFPEDVITFK
ncbi:MAG TPA: cold shock domain-containing protein [Methylococcaceae bacterium]|nr:cold shock domain-containing protein [Methylococcaceae bacterium]